ncbi:MAG: hypothetical protein DWQ36_07335 [Acidobacteria bacterium]|nr:MAG: hypothetical protein DWQ30_23265 [Acidobacteriota bacterium]REK09365.1 MAG: hypothetical protein DWQ36_07335 [Acidobacteriota bacterium]
MDRTTAILAVIASAIFLQTLFFKFTGAPETEHIFSTFSQWAEGFGAAFLFSRPGPLGPIGSGVVELAASLLLLAGTFVRRWRRLQVAGAALAVAMMVGAVTLHFITPLGLEVLGDGGLLFAMACTALLSGVVIVVLRRDLIVRRRS